MNTDRVYALLVIAIVGALVCAWQVRRALREPLERDRIVAAARDSYQGPDSLRLMQELDEHLDAYFARLSHLFEELGPPPGHDPMDAGSNRLRDAVRDNRKGGHRDAS